MKRLNWARQYMKLDFNKVIFTGECRATLDGPNGEGKVGLSRVDRHPGWPEGSMEGVGLCFGQG